MNPLPSRDRLETLILAFIRERFLSADEDDELAKDTPLIEYGILNSLNTVILVGFIQQEFDISIPLGKVSSETFETVGSISAALCNTASEQTG